MDSVDQATLDANTAQIDFLTSIIKAYRLHEDYCAAFSTTKGDFAGMFSGILERECHCWLDKDNRAPEGEGFGLYHIESKELLRDAYYVNRFYTREHILERLPHLSADPKSEDYWGKTYYIVEVTLKTESETTESPE